MTYQAALLSAQLRGATLGFMSQPRDEQGRFSEGGESTRLPDYPGGMMVAGSLAADEPPTVVAIPGLVTVGEGNDDIAAVRPDLGRTTFTDRPEAS